MPHRIGCVIKYKNLNKIIYCAIHCGSTGIVLHILYLLLIKPPRTMQCANQCMACRPISRHLNRFCSFNSNSDLEYEVVFLHCSFLLVQVQTLS